MKKQGIQRMILFIVEHSANANSVFNIKPSSGQC